jgi:hypothetical protein
VKMFNSRVGACMSYIDSDAGASGVGSAGGESGSASQLSSTKTPGVTPLATASPLVPLSVAEREVEAILAGAVDAATGTHITASWSLGSQVHGLSHLVFASSKLPLLHAGVAAMTAPESQRLTREVFIHAGRARQHRDNGNNDPRSAKTIFTQLAFRLGQVCNIPHTSNASAADGFGIGQSSAELFEQSIPNMRSAEALAAALAPLRVKPHPQKQNVFAVKFQDFDASGRTVQTDGLDWGGLFRECITLSCAELFRPDTLSLFVPAANASARLGQAGTFVPNPALTSAGDMAQFQMVGVLLGITIRLGAMQEFPLSHIVWKIILGTTPGIADLEASDESFVTALKARLQIASSGSQDEVEAMAAASAWEAISIDGTRVPLEAASGAATASGGVLATHTALKAHATALLAFRLRELEPAATGMRRGLAAMVPMRVLRVFTPAELSYLVQGEATIDVTRLKGHTKYAGQYSETHRVVKRFWRVMDGFSDKQRVEIIRFSWGRSRLPPPGQWPADLKFKVGEWRRTGQEPDSLLPIAATCSFALYLPAYSSDAVMRERLLLALGGTEYGTFDRA